MKRLLALVSVSAFFVGVAACSSDSSGDDDVGDDDGTSSSSSSTGGGGTDGGSTSSSGGGSSSSSGGSSGSSSGSSGNEFACAGVLTTGAAVTPTVTADDAPAAAGGTIAAGDYKLTAVTLYGSDEDVPPVTVKVSLKVGATQYLRAFAVSALGMDRVGSDSGTYTTAANSIVAAQTCEDGDEDNGLGGFSGGYTVEGNVLRIFQDPPAALSGDTIEYVLTKQ